MATNLWWVADHRRGLPFDIDEAGYLQRAVRDADALHSGGWATFASTVRLPDPQAPLLTSLTGVARHVTGLGSLEMLGMEQVFYVATVGCTYLICRRLCNRAWSLLAALLVASIPAVLNASRSFHFGLPATALLTATLVAQTHPRVWRSWPRSLVWGLLLGLFVLARTMNLAFAPMLVMGAIASLVATTGLGRRGLFHLTAGLVVAGAVAWSWYSATWHNVLRYLTNYGYGSSAAQYGSGHPVLSMSFWARRATYAANNEILLPILMALAAAVVVGVWARVRRHPVEPTASGPLIELWTVVVGGYLILTSTPNIGSDFDLPLVPVVVVLAVWLASRASPRARRAVIAASLVGAGLSFIWTSGLIPGTYGRLAVWQVGSARLTVVDGRGPLLTYAVVSCPPAVPVGCLAPGGEAPTLASWTAYLRRWPNASMVMAELLDQVASRHHTRPVVFFAVQDRLFNTNTVDLAYQVRFHHSLPTGLYLSSRGPGQLDDRRYGVPNLVITGPLPEHTPPSFLRAGDERSVVSTLEAFGFSPSGQVGLPDGRAMTLWWRPVGA